MSIRGRLTRGAALLAFLSASIASGVAAQSVSLVSRAASGPSASANGESTLGDSSYYVYSSGRRRLSSEGRYVVFSSTATNLVPGQVNAHSFYNVFRFDRRAETTTLVSHQVGALGVTGNAPAFNPVISADGCIVVFDSGAGDLAPPSMAPTWTQVFAYDCNTGSIVLVSHAAGLPGQPANAASTALDLSADGDVILFGSSADDLISGGSIQGGSNVYAYRRSQAQLTLVNRTAASATTSSAGVLGARLSADGRFVSFASLGSDLVAGFTQPSGSHFNVFLHELATGSTQLVTRQVGTVATGSNGDALTGSLSLDGRFVAFNSNATNLVPAQSGNPGVSNVFLFDRLSGTSTLVSMAAGTSATGGDASSYAPMVSVDGRYLAYESAATNLVPGFIGGALRSVFLYEAASGANRLVSHAASSSTQSANQESFAPVLSDGGNQVLFASYASDLVAGQVDVASPSADAFLFERTTGTVRLVSHASVASLRTGNGVLYGDLALSGDGRYAAFGGFPSDLVAADQNGTGDVFLFGPGSPLAFHTVSPCRAADTRNADAPSVTGGLARGFLLRGRCGVPPSAEAVAINLTVVTPTAPGFLAVYPAGQIAPLASNANFGPGQVRASNAIVAPGVGGSVSVLAGMSGQVDVLIDVVGYFE